MLPTLSHARASRKLHAMWTPSFSALFRPPLRALPSPHLLQRSGWLSAAYAGLLGLALGTPLGALAQAAAGAVPAFSTMAAGPVPAPWHFATLPRKKATEFAVATLDGLPVLRVHTQDAYGNLVLPLQAPASAAHQLQWRWRVDQQVADADLRQRNGDDAALKLCVSFDFDKNQLSWGERTKLRLGQVTTGEPIPTETLCYVWDAQLPVGAVLHSPFTHRLRYWVLRSHGTPLGHWQEERRDLAADYARAFGDESPQGMPALTALTVSADADNTHGEGLAYLGDVRLLP